MQKLKSKKSIDSLIVRSPARIHCALLNESGLFGRIDGSVGFALCEPYWDVEVSNEHEFANSSVVTDDEHRATISSVVQRFKAAFNLRKLSVSVRKSVPLHVGLGSKTSLVMGLGWAITRLLRLEWDAVRIAKFLGRGGTSGLGVHAFTSGGFIWDAGRKFPELKSQFGPSSSQLAAPPNKVFSFYPDDLNVVHFRFAQKGLFGSNEIELFNKSCPTDSKDTIDALSLLAGQLIPSLVDNHDAGLQDAIQQLQRLGLKRAEWAAQVRETLLFKDFWCRELPDKALGLSSMGPTMYCITRNISSILSTISKYGVRPNHLTVSKLYKGPLVETRH